MKKKIAAHQQTRIDTLIEEEKTIRKSVQETSDAVKELEAQSIAATATRDELQIRCTAMTQNSICSESDFSRLGQLTIAAIAAFDAIAPAKAARDAASAQANARLPEIETELQKLHHEVRKSAFSELVVEYEHRVVAAGLGKLSDEIRTAAAAASIPLENHSPLINSDYLMIGGYPLQVWS